MKYNKMDSFISQLSQTVEQKIIEALSSQVAIFAQNVSEHPEMSEITLEKIIEEWNKVSEFKLTKELVESSSKVTSKSTAPKKVRKPAVKKSASESVVEEDGNDENSGEDVGESEESEKKTSVKKITPQKCSTDCEGGCEHILETGANKGKRCGKKVVAGTKYCSTHLKKHQ